MISPKLRHYLKPLKPWYRVAKQAGRAATASFAPGRLDKLENERPDFKSLSPDIWFLVSYARSGTTAIYELLNSHPDIFAYNEILNPSCFFNIFDYYNELSETGVNVNNPDTRLNLFYWYIYERVKAQSDKKIVTFDIKIESMQHVCRTWQGPQWQPVVLDIAESEGFGIIQVTRDNFLARFVSVLKARESDQYHSYGGSKEGEAAARSPSVHIDPKILIPSFNNARMVASKIRDRFEPSGRYVEINYENMFEVADGMSQFSPVVLQSLTDRLQVEPRFEPKPSTGKVTSGSLERLIENYDEVAKVLAGTEFERFLDPVEPERQRASN